MTAQITQIGVRRPAAPEASANTRTAVARAVIQRTQIRFVGW
jgi:hypothetical protein